jgi:hypothetical protein
MKLLVDMNLSPQMKLELEAGALLSIDTKTTRLRFLPLT